MIAFPNSITDQTYILAVISGITVLLILYVVMLKKRSTKKIISAELQNRRILNYQPEPLIDKDLLKDLENYPLELLQPDENAIDTYNLAKINFLNLLSRNDVKLIAENSIKTYGVGSCGPRGFYGTIDVHLNLESKIAEFMGLEESVLYSYGFSTVASAIGAYCKKLDIIFSDENISFASKQGFLAARSTVIYFKHNDMKDLEDKLKEYEKKEIAKKKVYRKFLVVEGIYQKTGKLCPLPKLMELREKYMLRIFIDETLSFGVLGEKGKGVTEYYNIDRTDIDMIMGSLEGSIGSIGGFCVGASVVMEHQRLSGLGYCFSASLPAFLTEIAIYAIESFENDCEQFKKLENNSTYFHKKLQSLQNAIILSDPISPLKVIKLTNDELTINKIYEYCNMKNLYFIHDDEGIQLYVSINLTVDDINKICGILEEAFKQHI